MHVMEGGVLASPSPTDHSSAPRRRYPRWVAVAFGLVLGLLTAEGAARLVCRWLPRCSHTWLMNGPSCLDLYPENPRRYYTDARRRPDWLETHGWPLRQAIRKGHLYGVEYRLNTAGFREAEFPPPDDSVRRIAFIGDSFTYGEGVKEPDVYPRVFERLLRASGDATPVINLGRFGFDIERIHDTLETCALPLGAKEIYYGFVLNDPMHTPEFDARHAPGTHLMRYVREDAESLALVTLVRRAQYRRKVTADTTAWYQRMYTGDNPGYRQSLDLLRRMHQLARERGAELRIVIFPLFYSLNAGYPFRGIHRQLADFCASEGIPCLDLLPVYEGMDARRLWITSFNLHPNEIAHGMAAEAVFRWRQGLAGSADPAP